MSKFVVGDKVKVIKGRSDTPEWLVGREGVVSCVWSIDPLYQVAISMPTYIHTESFFSVEIKKSEFFKESDYETI